MTIWESVSGIHSMASLFKRSKTPSQELQVRNPTEVHIPELLPTRPAPPKDPNVPDRRLQLHQKCVYERQLPGNAFISAHVNRLQHGFYQSAALHEPTLDNLFFVSVHFVFHPHDSRAHRFKAATIRVSISGDSDPANRTRNSEGNNGWYSPPLSNPRILHHAPELMYGAVSPENLQWNFSLSSSLGISQTPLAASLNPAGGVRGSYKVYDMMSIQGSLRTLQSPLGPEYDVEDGMALWTLEENKLQRSGLPREFDFVLLVYKPDGVRNMFMRVDVEPVVGTWFGDYPQWYMDLPSHRPSHQHILDFDNDIGQKFVPTHQGRGFNFADLPLPLEEYVTMPGTTYPTNDALKVEEPTLRRPKTFRHHHHLPHQHSSLQPHPKPDAASQARDHDLLHPGYGVNRLEGVNSNNWAPPADTINVRVLLEHARPTSTTRTHSASPMTPIIVTSTQNQVRRRSIRRTRSRAGLKEYSAQQALQQLARETLTTD